jgi:hypothetical protein
MRDRQGRFALETQSDPIDQITALAERLDAMMEQERRRADLLQSELEAERAERKRLDARATNMALALTVALTGLRAGKGSNGSDALTIAAARRAVREALRSAA